MKRFLDIHHGVVRRIKVAASDDIGGSDEEKLAELQLCDPRAASELLNSFRSQRERYVVTEEDGEVTSGIPHEAWLELERAGRATEVFEDLLSAVDAPAAPLFHITRIIDGVLQLDPDAAVESMPFWTTIYFDGFTIDLGHERASITVAELRELTGVPALLPLQVGKHTGNFLFDSRDQIALEPGKQIYRCRPDEAVRRGILRDYSSTGRSVGFRGPLYGTAALARTWGDDATSADAVTVLRRALENSPPDTMFCQQNMHISIGGSEHHIGILDDDLYVIVACAEEFIER